MSRQVMSHPNPPQIVFPKKVGSTELKEHISNRVSQVLNLMIPEIDCSNDTITMKLRRSGAGRTQGFIVHSYESKVTKRDRNGNWMEMEGQTGHQEVTEIDFNLQKGTMNPTDNESEWLLILTHELIHWVQSKVGAHFNTVKRNRLFSEVTNHYNTNNMRVITYRVLEAVGLYSPSWAGISSEGMEFTTGTDKTSRKPVTTKGYYLVGHEKQAHRLSLRIVKDVFKMQPPQAYSVCYARTLENEHTQKAMRALDARGWQVVAR